MTLTTGFLSFLWGKKEKERTKRIFLSFRTLIKTEKGKSIKLRGGTLYHAVTGKRELHILFCKKVVKTFFY